MDPLLIEQALDLLDRMQETHTSLEFELEKVENQKAELEEKMGKLRELFNI